MEHAEPFDVGRRLTRGITDLIVLVIVMQSQLDVFRNVFGVHNHALLIALVLGSVSQAAYFLLEARRESSVNHTQVATPSSPVVVAVVAPWIIVGVLHATHQGWLIWQSVSLPAVVRVAGASLALSLVLSPPRWQAGPPRQRAVGASLDLTVQTQVLMISALMVSGSIAFAMMSAYWVVVVLVGRAAQRSLATVPVGATFRPVELGQNA